jgi:hypothetical protein
MEGGLARRRIFERAAEKRAATAKKTAAPPQAVTQAAGQ